MRRLPRIESVCHVYEGDKLTCCGCSFLKGDEFTCDTEPEMMAHIREHDAAGHHVRRSLLISDEERKVEDDAWRLKYDADPQAALVEMLRRHSF